MGEWKRCNECHANGEDFERAIEKACLTYASVDIIMLSARLEFSDHACLRMTEKCISEAEVRRIIERGICAPEAVDLVAAPRFSYRAMLEGSWFTVVVAVEPDRIVVVTIIG
ncbi:MAG: DUF4258 domain-containing protein [Gemmatimonadaceae bacterium]|nr:DUF4258 domain-containing protein [Gemmatimonadaceae bacterium]